MSPIFDYFSPINFSLLSCLIRLFPNLGYRVYACVCAHPCESAHRLTCACTCTGACGFHAVRISPLAEILAPLNFFLVFGCCIRNGQFLLLWEPLPFKNTIFLFMLVFLVWFVLDTTFILFHTDMYVYVYVFYCFKDFILHSSSRIKEGLTDVCFTALSAKTIFRKGLSW